MKKVFGFIFILIQLQSAGLSARFVTSQTPGTDVNPLKLLLRSSPVWFIFFKVCPISRLISPKHPSRVSANTTSVGLSSQTGAVIAESGHNQPSAAKIVVLLEQTH